MKTIIKHGIAAPSKDKIDNVTFKCDYCGCVFKTGYFYCNEIGKFGFTNIYQSCPECKRSDMIKKLVRTSFILKQLKGD